MKFLLALVFPLALAAQSNDIGLIGGLVFGVDRLFVSNSVSNFELRTDRLAGGVFNYSRKLAAAGPTHFFLDLPIFGFGSSDVRISNSRISTWSASAYFTPGVRFRWLPQGPVSPYAFFGVGLGGGAETDIGPGFTRLSAGPHAAISTGGGLDVRVWKAIHFRGELRALRSQRSLLGGPGWTNSGLGAFGVSFLF